MEKHPQKRKDIFNTIETSIVNIGDGLKTGFVSTGKIIKKGTIKAAKLAKRYWKPILVTVLTFSTGLAVAILLNKDKESGEDIEKSNEGDENEMKMPQEIFEKLSLYWDHTKAVEWSELMKKGEITLEQATAQADMWEKYSTERSFRRDIQPSEWPDFEDGQRPNN